MKIPFMDLRIVNSEERSSLIDVFNRLMGHGHYIMGPEVERFESEIAKYCNRKYCVGVSSGTAALYITLKALNIGSGDEVITTSLSWVATANAIAMTGATPVFADIGDDLNMNTASAKELISSCTKAILPVHYTGRAADVEGLKMLSEKHDIPVIFDAAQAFGSTYKKKPIGKFGNAVCFSMNPMKTLGALGEAGAIVTDDKKLYERMQVLRYNGTINKETCIEPSLNGRLDSLQAAILVDRLHYLEPKILKRKQICAKYDKLLDGVVITPEKDSKDSESSFYSYTIMVKERHKLIEYLTKNGVETKIQHPILMCEQKPYLHNKKADVSNAKRVVKEILCLPANENISEENVMYISSLIKDYYEN